MSDSNECIRNKSIASYARINLSPISVVLTAMLIVNSLGVVCSLLLFANANELCRTIISFISLCIVSSIILYFATKNYIQNMTVSITTIEVQRMQMIARLAKRFYVAFFLSMLLNIITSALGTLALIICFVHG